jgi:hypothetical protein
MPVQFFNGVNSRNLYSVFFLFWFKGSAPQDLEDIEDDILTLMQIKEKRFEVLSEYAEELYKMVHSYFAYLFATSVAKSIS